MPAIRSSCSGVKARLRGNDAHTNQHLNALWRHFPGVLGNACPGHWMCRERDYEHSGGRHPAHNSGGARHFWMLSGSVDLILCSVQFDESRMFELLAAAKSSPRTRSIPFMCFRHLDSVLRPASFRGLEIACRAYGAEFIDPAAWRAQYGTDETQKRFREVVFSHLHEGSRGIDRPPASGVGSEGCGNLA